MISVTAEAKLIETFVELFQQSPFFCQALAEIACLHILKNQDYASKGPFSNFHASSNYASAVLGKDVSPAESFAVLRGTKFARLDSLTQTPGKRPNFESIEDTEKDFIVYKLLHRAHELQQVAIAEAAREAARSVRRARRAVNKKRK